MFTILFPLLHLFQGRRNKGGQGVPMTRWPCPAADLPTLEVLPAEYREAWGELRFTGHSAKFNGALLLHLDIYEVCMELYDPLFTACPSVVLWGLHFLPCPTFIPPCIQCMLWTSRYRGSPTAAQPLSLTTLWLQHPPLAQYSQRLSITPASSQHHF